MRKIYIIVLFISLIFAAGSFNDLQAQNFGLGETKFVVVGNAQVDFVSSNTQSQFRNLAFKPIFLWSLSDRLFIESELEFATDEGSVELVLEYVNMVYFVNKNLAIHGGRFLPKFGGYRGRFGEAFLNKFATDPVGFGDGGIGPMIETGIGLQGGAQLGLSKINYDLYVTNGPKLLVGSPDAPGEAGQFDYEPYDSNNKGKAMGGRFGFLPFSNSSLEIGYSIEHKSRTGDLGDPIYEKTPVTMQAIDLSYFTSIDFIKSTIRILGEWKSLSAGNVAYEDQFNPGNTYTFDNKSTAYYALFSIRPSQSSNGLIHNFELAARYSQFNSPDGAIWGNGKKQTAIGLNYWYRWNGALKLTYQKQDSYLEDGENMVVAQLVYGF